jgi:hypothetical protein
MEETYKRVRQYCASGLFISSFERVGCHHMQVQTMGGIQAYAQLLQATLDEAVRKTAGIETGHYQDNVREVLPSHYLIDRPEAHRLDCFCIQAKQSQGESVW